ncbi:type V CRISPR-associated protein Cas4 [Candidatus Gracilibacteria bacterium]|nr:type V CRISPR-associated protein Cas4 [Candidatus Gracilibacteria bacterium]
MHSYILLSALNDFIFCPRSLYYHHIYDNYQKELYQTTDQVLGTEAHKAVDMGKYSSRKTILQGMNVVSNEYGILGKIDTFDLKTGILTERKRKIKKIYQGYIWQLYGEYFCLSEMGYVVTNLRLYSMEDNKVYPIPFPNFEEKNKFKRLLKYFREYYINTDKSITNKNKCKKCIYRKLCQKNFIS